LLIFADDDDDDDDQGRGTISTSAGRDFASQPLSIETMPGDWSAPATCGDIRR